MSSIFLIETIIVFVIGFLFLVCIALLIYGIWLLNKTMKRLDRLDSLDAELRTVKEEVHSLKGNYPPAP